MKSAYELAMERYEKETGDKTRELTDEQKEQLQAVDRKCEAKIAEKEIFLNRQIDQAGRNGQVGEVEQIKEQLRRERERIREDAEAEKEKIRGGK